MRYTFHHNCDQEINHVTHILSQSVWFTSNKYTLSLPDGITDSSSERAIACAVSREFPTYEKLFRTYVRACQRALNKHHVSIDAFFALFNYPLPSTITVQCTAYGPGGSYAPPDTIIVKIPHTDANSLQLIIHESVHLVLEEPFIQKYALAHWEKEYIVDHLCKQSGIADFAHTYTIQKYTTPPSEDIIRHLRFAKMDLLTQ